MVMIMSDEREDRRETNRVYFTHKENIVATIQTHAESQVSLPITLLSVSFGGLSFLCPREKVLNIIKVGDPLTITDLKTPQPLGPIASFGVEVKYIRNYEGGDRIGIGCNFTKISDGLRNKIKNFVEYRIGTAKKEAGENPS
jgi:hypothetical protein